MNARRFQFGLLAMICNVLLAVFATALIFYAERYFRVRSSKSRS